MVLGAALEILLRGVLFRYFEKMIGTLGAILGLVGICAILHLVFWPDRDQFHSGYYSANFASVTIVALIMGAGLSLVFAFTRSLWPCIAAQAVWFAFERHPLTGERPTIFLVDVAGGNVPPVWTGFGLGVQGTIPFIVGGLLVLRWLAKRSKEKQLVGYEGVPAPQKG
jgi:membrane protease YdiL (CAAX protease family)